MMMGIPVRMPFARLRPILEIRKTIVFLEEVRSEAGKRISPPLLKVAVAAIVQNPFAGKDQADLALLTEASQFVGRDITSRAVALLEPLKPESYGKAAIVGLSGE